MRAGGIAAHLLPAAATDVGDDIVHVLAVDRRAVFDDLRQTIGFLDIGSLRSADIHSRPFRVDVREVAVFLEAVTEFKSGDQLLAGFFPDIAGHLLAASVMAAPAGIVVSKMLVPETAEPVTKGRLDFELEQQNVNVIDAAAGGASDGLRLARWDFLFYAVLGTVVTSSVHIAGVLLVFTMVVSTSYSVR